MEIVNKLSVILKEGINRGVNQFCSYMCKVYACNVFEKIAGLLKQSPQKDKLNLVNIYLELNRISKNRIIQVQKSAQKAMNKWAELLDPEINIS